MARVVLLVGEKRGRFPGSNCLYLKDGRARALVDAGCRREQILRLRDTVDAVIYTHIHPDHITHHELLAGKTVYAPAADGGFSSIHLLALRYAPEIAGYWLDYVRTVFGLTSVPTPARLYEPWEDIVVGDIVVEAMPARGHTAGHSILRIGRHVHLSDVDLTGFGPWYGHHESSIEAFLSDISLAATLEGDSFTSSHREKIFSKEEVLAELNRYRSALERQVRSVVELLEAMGTATPGDLARERVIYRRYIPGLEVVMNYFERNMVEKILDYLVSMNMAIKTGKGYRIAGSPVKILPGRV